jgi:branched-chain amino acid aminotransferase
MSIIPFDDRDGWIWFDGQFVSWRDAKVHVLTHGLHYASAVFEGERMYGGEIYASEAHTDRLFASAEILDFQIPFSKSEITAAKLETCRRNGLTDCYVRPLAWRGTEMIGVSAQNTKVHVMIATWDWPSYFDPEQKKKGIRLTYAKYRRPDPRSAPVHAKATGLYMICTLSKHEAERAGYADALFLDCYDNIAEATGANIFLIKDGVIHTPTPESFLNGITRQSVIKLARQRGFEVVERTIPFSELGSFSEVFITGSAAEVTPVSEIGEFRFTPGNISLSLMDDYAKMVRRQLQPIEA